MAFIKKYTAETGLAHLRLSTSHSKPVFTILLLAAIINGVPILLHKEHLRGWDARTHIFFASGYLNDWWQLWEPRWYGGYDKVSYPPLAHQLLALMSKTSGDIYEAYGITLWLFLTVLPLGVYTFSKSFVDQRSSIIASLVAVFLPSVRMMAFSHGQFAGLASLVFLLFGLAAFRIYLKKPTLVSSIRAISLLACSVASHHATILFFLPLVGPMIVIGQLRENRTSSAVRLTLNILLITTLSVLSSFIVILPYWAWMLQFSIQTPIEHASRENFLQHFDVAKLYFLDIYQFLLLLIPLVLVRVLKTKNHSLLFLVFLFYFVIGLGGTTPLPAIVFGEQWEWLTFERFSVWASILLLPLIGELIIKSPKVNTEWFIKPAISLLVCSTVLWMVKPDRYRTTPPPIELNQVIDDMIQNPLCLERFLALGFGSQLPDFSVNTNARTLDGLWHSARSDPLLRSSGIGSISDSLYWQNGDVILRAFLQRTTPWPAYCIYLNENAYGASRYESIITDEGWKLVKVFDEGITLWVTDDYITSTLQSQSKDSELYEQLIWGILPIAALGLAFISHLWLWIYKDLYEVSSDIHLSS